MAKGLKFKFGPPWCQHMKLTFFQIVSLSLGFLHFVTSQILSLAEIWLKEVGENSDFSFFTGRQHRDPYQ
jgi:hypothetical protein